jgi:hypothetical protein
LCNLTTEKFKSEKLHVLSDDDLLTKFKHRKCYLCRKYGHPAALCSQQGKKWDFSNSSKKRYKKLKNITNKMIGSVYNEQEREKIKELFDKENYRKYNNKQKRQMTRELKKLSVYDKKEDKWERSRKHYQYQLAYKKRKQQENENRRRMRVGEFKEALQVIDNKIQKLEGVIFDLKQLLKGNAVPEKNENIQTSIVSANPPLGLAENKKDQVNPLPEKKVKTSSTITEEQQQMIDSYMIDYDMDEEEAKRLVLNRLEEVKEEKEEREEEEQIPQQEEKEEEIIENNEEIEEIDTSTRKNDEKNNNLEKHAKYENNDENRGVNELLKKKLAAMKANEEQKRRQNEILMKEKQFFYNEAESDEEEESEIEQGEDEYNAKYEGRIKLLTTLYHMCPIEAYQRCLCQVRMRERISVAAEAPKFEEDCR